MGYDAYCRVIYGYAVPLNKCKGRYYNDLIYEEDGLSFVAFYLESSDVFLIGIDLGEIYVGEYTSLNMNEKKLKMWREKFEDSKETLKLIISDKEILNSEPKLQICCYLD
ncbi:MAG: hypothetical protein ACTSRZ_17240 [Promethearchaeota archaeon]